jgi:hypothetical protein
MITDTVDPIHTYTTFDNDITKGRMPRENEHGGLKNDFGPVDVSRYLREYNIYMQTTARLTAAFNCLISKGFDARSCKY